ncbi:MAG: chromate efflux transporter [Chthoniobacterales bacterium]
MQRTCQEKAAADWPAAVRFFARLGWISFGGPAGQIAILREELVERRRWLSPHEFAAGLNFCLLLPGPEAHQLVIYSGWKLHGLRGALVAGALFVLPAVLLLWLAAGLYAVYGQLDWVQTVFGTVRPAVLAIIMAALVRMGRHHLPGTRAWLLAGAAFAAMFFYEVPFPWIVVAALGLGAVKHFTSPVPESGGRGRAPSAMVSWRILGVGLLAWFAPVALAALVFGADSVLASLGFFFSKVAVVTFGGAYAVLPYVADHAVYEAGWLSAAAMKDGLALAETLPGPLVKVLQFAGFLAGWNNPSPLAPWAMGTLGALITSWVTFVPSFLFILAGAPFVERLAESPRARTVLDTVTAAIIGVIANLAAWFATGIFAAGQPVALYAVIAGVTLWLLMGRGWSVPAVVGMAAAAGLVRAAM